MTRIVRYAALAGLGAGLLLVSTPSWAEQHARVSRRVGPAAHARARNTLARRRGGVLRFAWRNVKGGVLGGVLGAGVGYAMGGPATATAYAIRGAGGGVSLASMFSGRSGIHKYSARSFAKADLAAMKGQHVRKHLHRVAGIIKAGVESGIVAGTASAGFGTLLGGPASALPSAVGGLAVGAAFGAAMGLGHAYVVPMARGFSLNRAISKANRVLGKLERDPGNTAWMHDAARALSKVKQKADNVPRMSRRQTRRFQQLQQRAAGAGLSQLGSSL